MRYSFNHTNIFTFLGIYFIVGLDTKYQTVYLQYNFLNNKLMLLKLCKAWFFFIDERRRFEVTDI